MKLKLAIIPIIIVVCVGLVFALKPSPSIELKDESVLGQTTTQVV